MFPGNANLPIGTSNTHWSAAARRRFYGCMYHDQTKILPAGIFSRASLSSSIPYDVATKRRLCA